MNKLQKAREQFNKLKNKFFIVEPVIQSYIDELENYNSEMKGILNKIIDCKDSRNLSYLTNQAEKIIKR